MKAWVIYDSVYGNTEKVAKAVASALGDPPGVELVRAGRASPDKLSGADIVIVGAPTQGFRPLESVQLFLQNIPADSLRGIKVAAFDTRIAGKESGRGARLVARMGGYAAGRIAEALKQKGGNLVVSPEGFAVNGREGPLATGELERAFAWARTIMALK